MGLRLPHHLGLRRRGVALIDVLVAGVLLGVALAVIASLSSEAIRAQIEGEKIQTAAMLLDELLSEVVAVGPENYPGEAFMDDGLHPDYEGFEFSVEVDGGETGRPFRVIATVWWDGVDGDRREEAVTTIVAHRLGEEEIGDREPEEVVER